MEPIETRIAEWRTAVLRSLVVTTEDADELEGHLRDQITDLEGAGLSADEAFLIAVGRLGKVDKVTAEFAREHGDRLWRQLAVPDQKDNPRLGIAVMLGFAILTAVLIQILRVFTESNFSLFTWLLRDAPFLVLPVLAAYFAVVKRMSWRRIVAVTAAVAVFAIAINVYPFVGVENTLPLAVLHVVVVLWFIVGIAHLGGRIRSSGSRMDFLRFSGEWVIYYTLIALGGAVLIGLSSLILVPISPEAPSIILDWVLPSGIVATVIVAAWLVEAKKSIIENLAPVLTAIFTPLFAIMLVIAVIAYALTGAWNSFDRELLTVFDALLLVVLALVVYGISARDRMKATGIMDVVRLCAVAAAVILDALVLTSMFERVGEFGFTANRVAALGLNLILFVNLVVTVWLLARQLAKKATPVQLESWQTGYLPVFAVWAATVVLIVPPVFGFA